MTRPKARLLIIAALAAAIVAALLLWLGRPKPVVLDTIVVAAGPVSETVTNTRAGTVKACQRARMAPPSAGQIARLPVKKGDRVTTGQILLELWNDDLQANLAVARRDAHSATAKREQACIDAATAGRESARQTKLVQDRLVSVEQAERAAGQADSAAAACRAANAQVRVSEARIDAANAALERTRLRAPFDGTVAEINGEIGEFVTPSPVGIPTPPAVDVVDARCIYITAPIDEVDAPRVREGMRARVTLDAFKDRHFAAHVRRVAPYVLDVEKQARTVEVEAEIEQRDGADLLPGYSADLEVVIAERPNVLRIPTRALIEGTKVYVLEAGRVRLRPVVAGLGNWEYTEIRSGLRPGERVVLTIDREGLRDGVAAVSR
ncbi:MAG TPA: efflux RND transporter periplasmic adaptor subunit [Steroidobacteraceae bacterium]|nr:efflux RND transporter periplasmic adaptor subunit [Steroidobacteraceae bacterium]